MTTYSEKLQHPEWQRKRSKILERDDFTCQLCGSKTTTLHVHHRNYIAGRNPWDYVDSELTTYCKDCHLMIEILKQLPYKIISITKSLYGQSAYYTALVTEDNANTIIILFRHNAELKSIDIISRLDEVNLKSMLDLIEFGKKLIPRHG